MKQIAVKFLIIYMKFVSEIIKLTWNCVRGHICRRLWSEFVNSFARRRHLFDIATKPIDVDSNFLLYSAPLYRVLISPKI